MARKLIVELELNTSSLVETNSPGKQENWFIFTAPGKCAPKCARTGMTAFFFLTCTHMCTSMQKKDVDNATRKAVKPWRAPKLQTEQKGLSLSPNTVKICIWCILQLEQWWQLSGKLASHKYQLAPDSSVTLAIFTNDYGAEDWCWCVTP